MFGPHPDGRTQPDLALGWPRPDVEVRLVDAKAAECRRRRAVQRTPAT